MQRLARVDVADAGDDVLIEQGDLQRDAPLRQAPRQRARVERARERLRSQAAERGVLRQAIRRPTRSMMPNRRGSLNVTVMPDDIVNTT